MTKFSGYRVLVTGAGGVLGAAVVEYFADRGATIAQLDVVAIDNPHMSRVCDLTRAEQAKTAIDQLALELGGIDVLANVAGGFAMGDPVHKTGDDTWDFMFNINLKTMLNAVRATVPHMATAQRGKIINVGARAGLTGGAHMGAYSASKSAVMRLTESMAGELKEDGINVNAVLPSIIDTPRNRADMPDADHSAWVRPEALAEVIGFLASPAADPIHGALLPVDGLS